MQVTVPKVGQLVRCVMGDDNGLGGQAVLAGVHTGKVTEVDRIEEGWRIVIQLTNHHNYCDDRPPEDCPEAWVWYHADECGNYEYHPNGFRMNALMAFHYHWQMYALGGEVVTYDKRVEI